MCARRPVRCFLSAGRLPYNCRSEGGTIVYEAIDLQIREGVAHLTLNRPRAANAMNVELARELMYAALQCDEDPAVRAVVVAGAGPMFCAGGGLKAFAGKGGALPCSLYEGAVY